MKWRDRKDFDHPQDTTPGNADPDAFDKSPEDKRSHRVSCAESAKRTFRVSAIAPGQRRRVRRSFLGQRANRVPPVIWRSKFLARADSQRCAYNPRAQVYYQRFAEDSGLQKNALAPEQPQQNPAK